MNKSDECSSWVVYRMTLRGKATLMSAVCQQDEWELMELAHPGQHTLIREGISNEGEAERLARNSSGGAKPDKFGEWKLPSQT